MSGLREFLGREAVHPFPARMAPPVAVRALENLPDGAVVLDPMMGSGTVVAIARALGLRAIGVDIDPLSVLNGGVWTTAVNRSATFERALCVLERAKHRSDELKSEQAYPRWADDETRSFLKYWFDARCRRELHALSGAIHGVRSIRERAVLLCAFSRMIIAKERGVSRARDLSHSRPHRVHSRAPITPLEQFISSVDYVLRNCIDSNEPLRGPHAFTRVGDARALAAPSSTVDAVMTSPPYLNAIDYMRCSKFSLVWMGYTIEHIRGIRARSIGTQVGLEPSAEIKAIIREAGIQSRLHGGQARMVARYVGDLLLSLSETHRVLKRRGIAVLVVGENTLKGNFIPTARLVSIAAARCGLVRIARSVRKLPPNRRYMPPPSATSGQMSERMSREVVLTFLRR